MPKSKAQGINRWCAEVRSNTQEVHPQKQKGSRWWDMVPNWLAQLSCDVRVQVRDSPEAHGQRARSSTLLTIAECYQLMLGQTDSGMHSKNMVNMPIKKDES